MSLKDLELSIESELLCKLNVISAHEEQTLNKEVIACIEDAIKRFEEEHGVIKGL